MKTVSASVDIAAPPARVWQILADFPRYPDWNPLIRSISGPLEVGAKLSVRIQPPGGKSMVFRPKVLAAVPESEFRWKGNLLFPGILDGEHVFQLQEVEGGTIFRHAETFSGVLVGAMGPASLEAIREGFAAMNEAIKRRAEA